MVDSHKYQRDVRSAMSPQEMPPTVGVLPECQAATLLSVEIALAVFELGCAKD